MTTKIINNKKSYLIFKNLLDILIALSLLITGIPVFLVISILVKFSSRGPIFFYHRRIGKDKKPFYCIKFRTMHPEAEDIMLNLLNENENLKREFEKTQKLKNDPRITAIGKFLRKTSLDELPQLLNVIRMEMSIIGPRPVVEEELERYGSSVKKVLSIKPGISGLWQVSGRNNLTYDRRVKLDCYYINNLSLLMDLRIIIRTIGVILFPKDRGAF